MPKAPPKPKRSYHKSGHLFVKGKSGNPKGRPKQPLDVKELAREYTKESITRLVYWMRHKDHRASIPATDMLLSRAWGKPSQDIKMQGELLIGIAAIVRDARSRADAIDPKPINEQHSEYLSDISATVVSDSIQQIEHDTIRDDQTAKAMQTAEQACTSSTEDSEGQRSHDET